MYNDKLVCKLVIRVFWGSIMKREGSFINKCFSMCICYSAQSKCYIINIYQFYM